MLAENPLLLSTYICYNINKVFDKFYVAFHGVDDLNLTTEEGYSFWSVESNNFLLLKMMLNASIETIGF